MGKRDIRNKETKKPKKDTKHIAPVEIASAPIAVEVIKKGKKDRPAD